MSTVSQSNPARAMNRAATGLPSDSQVPTLGRPSFSARFTGLLRMRFVSQRGERGSLVVLEPPRRRRQFRAALRLGGRRHLVRRGGDLVLVVVVRVVEGPLGAVVRPRLLWLLHGSP